MVFYLSLMSSPDLLWILLIINPLWMEWNIRFQFLFEWRFVFTSLQKLQLVTCRKYEYTTCTHLFWLFYLKRSSLYLKKIILKRHLVFNILVKDLLHWFYCQILLINKAASIYDSILSFLDVQLAYIWKPW